MAHSTNATAPIAVALTALLVLAGSTASIGPQQVPQDGADGQGGWTGAWSTAVYGPYPAGPLTQSTDAPPYSAQFAGDEAVEQSFRMVIHPSIGGERVRACFSNLLGTHPLTLTSASVAQRAGDAGPAIVPGSEVSLSFDGQPEATIPAGEKACSDGVDFSYAYGDDLAVTFHVPGPSGPMTWHAEAFSDNYVSPPMSGDVTGDPSGASFSQVERSWFFLSSFDVMEPRAPYAVATFGDSITDGFAGTPQVHHKYPDFLAERLHGAGVPAGVLNVGINSNTVTPVRSGGNFGEPGVERFQRDVLDRSDVGSVFVLHGTNDLSDGVSAGDVYDGLVDIADQAHEADVCVVVGTILPRDDPSPLFGWGPADERERRALNQGILASDEFDAVVDVAEALEDPVRDHQPFPPYFLEGLHPNSLGMQVLADAIPLEPLLPPPHGTCAR